MREPAASKVLIANMVAAPTGLVHEKSTESSSKPMVDQAPYEAANQTEISTTQVDDRMQPQAILPAQFIQPLDL